MQLTNITNSVEIFKFGNLETKLYIRNLNVKIKYTMVLVHALYVDVDLLYLLFK